jgi:hypothetical protein
VASRKGPRYGYRGSNPPTTISLGAGEVPSFPVPIVAHLQRNPALLEEKVPSCPPCREEGQTCQALGVPRITSGAHWPCAPRRRAWGCPRLWMMWWVVSGPSGRSQRVLPPRRPPPPANRSSPPEGRSRAESVFGRQELNNLELACPP